MTTKDVLALALEALAANEFHLVEVGKCGNGLHAQTVKAITAIKQAQQAQEPVTGFGKIVGTHGKVVEWPEFTEQAEPVSRCGGRGYCDRMPFCGCGGPDGLPERDPTKPAEAQGLFRKFMVQRVDGSDKQGGKHYGCEYFVLDVDHDPHAKAALQAYAQACAKSHPQLSADLIAKHGTAPMPPEAP